jgi:hypothetical protein
MTFLNIHASIESQSHVLQEIIFMKRLARWAQSNLRLALRSANQPN